MSSTSSERPDLSPFEAEYEKEIEDSLQKSQISEAEKGLDLQNPSHASCATECQVCPGEVVNSICDEAAEKLGITLTAEEKATIIKSVERKKVCRIMACGQTGAGKSTLLNGIVGRNVFKEGDTLNRETSKVTAHTWKEPGMNVEVIIYDTPGFNDASGKEDEYISNIRRECKYVGIFLYCISVALPRSENVLKKEVKTLEMLNAALEPDIWKRCIIVLTFANAIAKRYRQVGKKESQVKCDFKERIQEWKKKVQASLKEAGIHASDIPIVSAGMAKEPSILNDSDYWLGDLYSHIYDVAAKAGEKSRIQENLTSAEMNNADNIGTISEAAEAIFVLMQLNCHRFKEDKDVKNDSNLFAVPDQPIVVPPKSSLRRFLEKAGIFLGVTTSVTAAGATTGALIGALAIGIPSFGIAAGLGLVLGAVIGGGVSAGGTMMAFKIHSAIKDREEV